MKRWGIVFVAGVLAVLLATLPSFGGEPSPDLVSALQANAPHEEVRIIISLSDKIDPTLIKVREKHVRRSKVIKALKEKAEVSQGPLKSHLERVGSKRIVPLWIMNGIAASVPAWAVPELMSLPGVEGITLDYPIQLAPVAAGTALLPEWNISAIRAPDLWSLGFTGQGVVVANLDTGVDVDHPDLNTGWRGGSNSWFNPFSDPANSGQCGNPGNCTSCELSSAAPCDTEGHGTGTMGVMVGGSAGGTAIGVAPGAKWMAVKIFNDGSAPTTSPSIIHQAFQWLLNPDGDGATQDAPDIINGSWELDLINVCDLQFQPDIQALRAAGIAVVFSGGNTGPYSSTSISPANYPESFAVGAVDSSLKIASFSSRGPSACDNSLYPEVVAPGVNVRTADLTLGGVFSNSYRTVSGTSFAAPHVAGVMALMLSVFPDLTVDELEFALAQSALDLGYPGADNDYGVGLIDAAEAYRSLFGPIPDIAVSPASYTFGDTKEGSFSPPQTFTVTNQGLGDLVIGGMSLTGTDAPEFPIQNDGCSGKVLLPTESCSLQVTFMPASAGGKSAELSVSSNDPDENPFPVKLTGVGAERYESVTVLSPNGGEMISPGAILAIQWGAPSKAVRFRLDYSVDNRRTWHLISKNVTGSSFNWEVPVPRGNRPRTFIRVIGYNASGRRVGTDRSDASFAIEVVRLISPIGGSVLLPSGFYTITWEASCAVMI